ncbi:hypothetical protein D3C76_834470 [compost metagenome]
MQSPTLEAKGLRFKIETIEAGELWRSAIHLERYSEGQRTYYWLNSQIPGEFNSATAAFRVARLFVLANASGDRETLGSLNWIYRQRGVIFD